MKYSTRHRTWTIIATSVVAMAGIATSAEAQVEPAVQNAPAERVTRPKNPPKPPPINVVAEIGIDNCYKPGRIAPIRVVMDNTGDGITGRLTLTPNDGGKGTAMEVDLPRRGHKEYTLFARLNGSGSDSIDPTSWELRLWDRRSGGRTVYRQKLEPLQVKNSALILSCTGDGSGLQFLHDQQHYRVKHLSPNEMPRQWPGYEPADVVALNGRAWQEMDDEQRAALRIWLDQGGHGILCGESPTEWRDAEATGLIGCTPTDLASLSRVDCVGDWGGQSYKSAGGKLMTVSGPLRPGAVPLLIEGADPRMPRDLTPGARALVIRRPTVRGRVIWVGFDAFGQAVRNWLGNKHFWRRLLVEARSSDRPRSPELQYSQPALASATKALPRLPAPPHWALLAFGACYALIFGPVNILILRRLRRSVRAWFFMPGLALGMLVVVLAAGQTWGQARAVLNEVTLVETRFGSRSGWESGLLGVFSPTNRSFSARIEDPAPDVDRLLPASTHDIEGGTQPLGWPDQQLDGAVRWSSLPMQLFSIGWLPLNRPRDLAGSLEWSKTADNRLAVRNGTALRLRNAYLFRQKDQQPYLWLGTLEPGASLAIPREWTAALREREVADSGVRRELENRRFQEDLSKAWREVGASEGIASYDLRDSTQARVLLIAETDPGQGVELEGMPFTNRASLVVAAESQDPFWRERMFTRAE